MEVPSCSASRRARESPWGAAVDNGVTKGWVTSDCRPFHAGVARKEPAVGSSGVKDSALFEHLSRGLSIHGQSPAASGGKGTWRPPGGPGPACPVPSHVCVTNSQVVREKMARYCDTRLFRGL